MWSALSVSKSKHKGSLKQIQSLRICNGGTFILRLWKGFEMIERQQKTFFQWKLLPPSFPTCRLRYRSSIQFRRCVLSAAVVTVARFLILFLATKKNIFWLLLSLCSHNSHIFDFLLSAVSSHAWPSGSAMGRGGRGTQVTASLWSLVLRQPLHIYQGPCFWECATCMWWFIHVFQGKELTKWFKLRESGSSVRCVALCCKSTLLVQHPAYRWKTTLGSW